MADRSGRVRPTRAPNQMMLRRTLFLMIVCGIVAFIVLGIQLFRLQILEHDKYSDAATNQQLRETLVSASRGTIYDRNDKILARYSSPRDCLKSWVWITARSWK